MGFDMEIGQTARIVMDAMNVGINIIDTQGRIVFVNKAYRGFLVKEAGTEIGQVEGKILSDLRPGARLPEVLKDGRPVLHITRRETHDSYFVNMYPLYSGGTLIGGLSVVTFLEDAYKAREKLEELEARNRQILRRINKANGARYTFDDIIAVSPSAQSTKALAQKIAAAEATVLLEGESGTGKELYAQAIHNAGGRREGVFVAVNCSNFNPNTLESELFGYSEGAFTGAKKGGKIGLFEAAKGGTLFLDEISEMDLSLQAKLLRALQERRIRPLSSVKELDIDVRVIAACNVELHDYVITGRFRSDLFYRLNTFPVRIPPLRERTDDIPALCAAILAELSHKLHRGLTIDGGAMEILRRHNWPGNVRELRNVIEFSAYLSPDGVIQASALPANLIESISPDESLQLSEQVRHFEREIITRRIQVNGADLAGKKKTADELGISLATLYVKLKGITKN